MGHGRVSLMMVWGLVVFDDDVGLGRVSLMMVWGLVE